LVVSILAFWHQLEAPRQNERTEKVSIVCTRGARKYLLELADGAVDPERVGGDASNAVAGFAQLAQRGAWHRVVAVDARGLGLRALADDARAA